MLATISTRLSIVVAALLLSVCAVAAQTFELRYDIGPAKVFEIRNKHGKIEADADPALDSKGVISVTSPDPVSKDEIIISESKGRLIIEVMPKADTARIDVAVRLPERSAVRLLAADAQISISGDFREIRAESVTGTIYADLPLENLKYKFLWIASRPRFMSDVRLAGIKEKNAGKFLIEGEIKGSGTDAVENAAATSKRPPDDLGGVDLPLNSVQQQIDLEVRTGRGIVLLNVEPSEVPTNLVERPLTEAAKAIIKGGDMLLTNAIRRASPKFFGEYAATLPPRRTEPELSASRRAGAGATGGLMMVTVQVMDENNRAIYDLIPGDFELTEQSSPREIIAVEPTSAPFNLVLLLDVSGSVENYVDFIRKAARNFVNTVDAKDRVAIVVFNDDVKTLSEFSTDRFELSESLDTFDAGGGTAFYDSVGFVLSETLAPLKGERTAIVVLTDGEDNRSFLPFQSLLGSIQESGALIYPLYVPAGLIGSTSAAREENSADPLRDRFLAQSLSSRAQEEGETLARISGGVYYPISRLSELQRAYDDIVLQLRTAYSITYRSDMRSVREATSPSRLKVRVKRRNAFVKLGPISSAVNR